MGWIILSVIVVLIIVGFIAANASLKKEEKAKKEQEAKQEREREEREQEHKAEIEAIENLVKQHSAFDDGKLIHGLSKNAIALSRTGEIGIFTKDIEGMKVVNAKDIKSMRYEKVQEGVFETKMLFCVLNTTDFDNSIIKIGLGYNIWGEDDAKEKYNQIKQTWTALKGSGKKTKEATGTDG